MLSTSSQICSSMVVVLFVRRQQQQQLRRLITTTTTRATTTTKLKEAVVVGGVKQQHQQQQRSLLLLNPFSTMSMSYFDSNRTSNKRTMMTNSSNNTSHNNTIISNRGGAIIPNLLLSINNENENNNIEDGLIHLPPPDDPVGLQLYKKVLYCPITNILRTSLHIGTDDMNQKVNGIVVGDDDNILGNDDGKMILISSQDAKNHARNSGLRLLSSIHSYLNGDLSRVEQIINVTGIVNVGANSDSDSNNNNKVPYGSIIDGCSQVFAEAFGSERGIGTRVCYGGSIGSTVACYVELRIRPPL